MLIIVGVPLLYLESAIAQFSGLGPISVWKVQPMFKGRNIIIFNLPMLYDGNYQGLVIPCLWYRLSCPFTTTLSLHGRSIIFLPLSPPGYHGQIVIIIGTINFAESFIQIVIVFYSL